LHILQLQLGQTADSASIYYPFYCDISLSKEKNIVYENGRKI
jgi:hypothetical protein